MSEKLEDLTPNQRRALGKALAALETMASMWGVEIGLRRVSEQLAMKPEAERANAIAAFIEQAFIEGAYRHYLDRDPAANRELESASQPGGGEAEERAAQIADDVCAKSRNHLFRSAAKIIASKIRDSAPERIYLVVGDVEDETEFARLTDVTWCEDPQFDTDIEYVRIDRAAPSAGNGGAEGDAVNSAVISANHAANSERAQIIARAVQFHGRAWPERLTSGVMFYEGERITKADFLAEVRG